jgi:hypothetical protein
VMGRLCRLIPERIPHRSEHGWMRWHAKDVAATDEGWGALKCVA